MNGETGVTRRYLLAVGALTAVQITSTMCFNIAPVLAPAAAGDLGVQASDVAYFVSLVYLMSLVAAVGGASLAARIGSIRFTQAALAICAVGVALLASGGVWAAAPAALLIGLGAGPVTVASSQVLMQVTPKSLMNVTFSIKQSGVPVGFALVGVIVPPLARAIGWQSAALTFAAMLVVTIVALHPLRGRYDGDRPTAASGRRLLPRWGEIVDPLIYCWRHARMRSMCLAAGAFSTAQVTVVSFTVLYGVEQLGLGYVEAGALHAAATSAGAVGRIVWGAVADATRRPLAVLTGLAAAMSLGAFAFAAAEAGWPGWMLYGAAVLIGGTAIGWNGVFIAEVSRLAPPGRAGEFTGATSLFVFVGPLVWPVLFRGVIALTGSYSVGLCAVGVATLLSVLLLMQARRSV